MIRPGLYRHFKGALYEVIGIARHSETLNHMVVYRKPASDDLWVRPIAMFEEVVTTPTGERQPRFVREGE